MLRMVLLLLPPYGWQRREVLFIAGWPSHVSRPGSRLVQKLRTRGAEEELQIDRSFDLRCTFRCLACKESIRDAIIDEATDDA